MAAFASHRGFPRPSFINAGDGRHEHPSQEFLDEFSFLEQKGWDVTEIHVALLGDLFHGRTVHSKVDGLKIYEKVSVDLIAPPELSMPSMYEERMQAAGFRVRKFPSISAYLEQQEVAKLWYFTRLQLERMGDKVLDRAAELREAVTFREEFVQKLPEKTKFFHPLPRDARHPTVPFWLDCTEYNGWDQQSQNGYYTRIVLLGMLSGHFGEDFQPRPANLPGHPPPTPATGIVEHSLLNVAGDFIVEVQLEEGARLENSGKMHFTNMHSGIVIDGIAEGQSHEKIWALMCMVRAIIGFHHMGDMGLRRCEQDPSLSAGYISVPDYDTINWDRLPMKKLAAMVPGSILNIVSEGVIERCFKLRMPPRIYNLPDISCKNQACISHPRNNQHEVSAYFVRAESWDADNRLASKVFTCKFCEQFHTFSQIWEYKFPQIFAESR